MTSLQKLFLPVSTCPPQIPSMTGERCTTGSWLWRQNRQRLLTPQLQFLAPAFLHDLPLVQEGSPLPLYINQDKSASALCPVFSEANSQKVRGGSHHTIAKSTTLTTGRKGNPFPLWSQLSTETHLYAQKQQSAKEQRAREGEQSQRAAVGCFVHLKN